MKYVQPIGAAEDAPYSNGNPAAGTPGSPVPAEAIEHPQREIIKVIIEAGLTPDGGDVEQLYAAIVQIINDATASFQAAPVGSVIFMPVDVIPTNFVKGQGQLLALPAYDAIHDVYGTSYGGDGVTTVGMPELRGEFLRFWDDGRGIDSGRLIGGYQTDAFKSHLHGAGGSPNAAGGVGFMSSTSAGYNFNTSSVGSSETRPRNIAMLGLIKYQ